MSTQPFLKSLAQAYLSQSLKPVPLHLCCFVFPNRRSGTFFRHYLEELISQAHSTTPVILPEITTISDVVQDLSGLALAPRLHQLLLLYLTYCTHQPKDASPDFESFYEWGNTLLSDFADVDRSLCDPFQIFPNVRDLKEISANFLTDEQVQIIREYWGVDIPSGENQALKFWQSLDPEADLQGHFLALWEVMPEIYHEFTVKLLDQGMANAGYQLRRAVDNLKNALPQLPFERYIFAGFNFLTLGEICLFQLLQKRGKADFYWDCNSPVFKDHSMPAAAVMRRNVKTFPSLYTLEQKSITNFPKIEVVGTTSSTAMASLAGLTLEQWASKSKVSDEQGKLNTALVLPDSNLLAAAIHSIPKNFSKVNLTMGYSLKAVPLSSLLDKFIALHQHARKINDIVYFPTTLLKSLFTDPVLSSSFPFETDALLRLLSEKRLYVISQPEIADVAGEIAPLFSPIFRDQKPHEVLDSLQKFLDILSEGHLSPLDRLFNDVFSDYIHELKDALNDLKIQASRDTIFKILLRDIRSQSIPFSGEPLQGLQVMGMLETRCLDFDNIIILSMNEGIMPRIKPSQSLIPDSLRYGYHLPTSEHFEAVSSYYFFRLISRAKRVKLVYLSQTEGTTAGEPSRYILQLLRLFPEANVTVKTLDLSQLPVNDVPLSIEKSDWVIEKLNKYHSLPQTENEKIKALSPSSLNTFITCPLKFFFQSIAGLYDPEEATPYMQPLDLGKVIHYVLEHLYKEQRGQRPKWTVTAPELNNLISHPEIWEKWITEGINIEYRHLPKNLKHTPLQGETHVMGQVMVLIVKNMLKAELKRVPFDFTDAELSVKASLELDGLKVNFTGIIDRLESVSKSNTPSEPGQEVASIRIIDYKTGSEDTNLNPVSDLFNPEKKFKALRQLLLYCNLYNKDPKINKGSHIDPAIQPIVYLMTKIATEGIAPFKVENTPLLSHKRLQDVFMEGLKDTIHNIFDPTIAFEQTPLRNPEKPPCSYCPYDPLCSNVF